MAYPHDAASPDLKPAPRRGRGVRAGAALLCLLMAAPAGAQQPAAEPSEATGGTSLSPECRVPGSQLYTIAKLRAVKAALREKRPVKVLAIGGSAAPGSSASYPVKLEAALEQALPDVDVVIEHRGLQGEIASGAGERIRTMVAESEPDLVIWQVGTYDALARVEVEAFASALDESVAWIKSHGIDVVLVDPLYTASMAADAYYNQIVETVRTVAAREKVPLVRRYDALRYLSTRSDKGEGHMLGRQFRLNDLGLRCMAEHVTLAIAASLLQTEPAETGSAAAPATAMPKTGP